MGNVYQKDTLASFDSICPTLEAKAREMFPSLGIEGTRKGDRFCLKAAGRPWLNWAIEEIENGFTFEILKDEWGYWYMNLLLDAAPRLRDEDEPEVPKSYEKFLRDYRGHQEPAIQTYLKEALELGYPLEAK